VAGPTLLKQGDRATTLTRGGGLAPDILGDMYSGSVEESTVGSTVERVTVCGSAFSSWYVRNHFGQRVSL
jgi:hypothetical protein